MSKRYIVDLTPDERAQVVVLAQKGRVQAGAYLPLVRFRYAPGCDETSHHDVTRFPPPSSRRWNADAGCSFPSLRVIATAHS